jgi:8-oxo-dGTP diphosphatase
VPPADPPIDTWPKAAASAAIFRNGEVLIAERGKGSLRGRWSLPGGHIEPGERASEAARREVREETGIDAAILGLVDVHDVILDRPDGGLAAHYVIAVYYGHWIAGEPVAAADCADARFVALDSLGEYALTPGAAEIIVRASRLIESAGRSALT